MNATKLSAALLVAMCATAAAEPRFGVTADVGVPDGANAALVVRPISMLRVHGGVGHNYVSRGVRAGITLVPLKSVVTPTLSVDYGRYFEGDANPLARMITGDESFESSLLEKVGYDYANAHVGLELGRKRFTFYIHAGASRITSNVRGLELESVTFSQDPRMTMWTVSARLGFVLYLVK